jgi:hypothetical protein
VPPDRSVARLITPLREVIRHVAEFFITLIVGKQRSAGQSGHRGHDPHAGA